MNTAAGMTKKNIRSNFWVKSKSSRHPWTPGPKASSLKHPTALMTAVECLDNVNKGRPATGLARFHGRPPAQ